MGVGAPVAEAAQIAGVVYDSDTGQPVSGVPVQLFYDSTDAVDPGAIVPTDRLGSGQQGQLTNAGVYTFDVESGRRYRLHVPAATTPYAFPSSKIAARPGFAQTDSSGQVVTDATPSATNRRYYLRFDVQTDTSNALNNHVAVDPLAVAIQLDKRVNRSTASVGDILLYKVTVKNRSNRNLVAAENRAVFIRDAPGRGLSYVRNRAVARVGTKGAMRRLKVVSDFGDARTSQRSRRLIKFGPFDLAAGQTLELTYQVVVGGNGRPGRYKNLAVLVDAGGVKLSNESTATVNVRADSALHTGAVIGRVYCDANGDGKFDPGEKGLAGARVYIETGKFAITDPAGFYHLSRVAGGTHLVKLDEGTLAGGSLTSAKSHLLRLTMGLSAKANFGAKCTTVAVRPEGAHGRLILKGSRVVTPPVAKKPKRVKGQITRGSMSLTIDGQVTLLPTATIQPVFPKSLLSAGSTNNLVPVPAKGWAPDLVWWKANALLPMGVAATSWKFVIARADGTAVKTMSSKGKMPTRITWNGLDDNGVAAPSETIYTAQLTIEGDKKSVRATSPLKAFAISYGKAAAKPTEAIWHGKLFAGTARRVLATKLLKTKLAAFGKTLHKGAKILVEAHSSGRGGSRLAQITLTQSQAKLVQKMLVKAGVPEANISVRGRGSIEQLEPPRTKKAREKNRRLVIVVSGATSANSGKPIVAPLTRLFLRLNGRVLRNSEAGPKQALMARFSMLMGKPGGGVAVLEMQTATGRSMRMAIDVPDAPRVKPTKDPVAPKPKPVEQKYRLDGDLAAGTLAVVGSPNPFSSPLAFDLLNVKVNAAANIRTLRKRRLRKSIVFTPGVPATLQIKSWELSVMDAQQNVLYSAGGIKALPQTVKWNGRDEGKLVLKSGGRFLYRLIVTDASGAQGWSSLGSFTVDGRGLGKNFVRPMRRSLFTRRGTVRPSLRNLLSVFASRVKTRPASERYTFKLTLRARSTKTALQRLHKAVRLTKLREYITRLGVAKNRYDVVTKVVTRGRDSLVVSAIASTTAKPVAKVQLLVDGVSQPVGAGKLSVPLGFRPNKELVIDITLANGRRANYRVAPPVTPPTIAPKSFEPGVRVAQPGRTRIRVKRRPIRRPRRRVKVSTHSQASAVTAGNLTLYLPAKDAKLKTQDLVVTGKTDPANRVVIGNKTKQRVHVASDGRFSVSVKLPVGESKLTIRTVDKAGNRAEVKWPVNVADQHIFVMGLGEAIATSAYAGDGWNPDRAFLPGMTEDSTVTLGSLKLHGRVAGYLKARVRGGELFDSVNITAHIDTARPSGSGVLFNQIVDPVRDFPVYGDTSTEVADVNTRGKLYVRVQADKSKAIVGSFHTRMSGGHLFRYDRTVDGALIHAKRKIKKADVDVRAFGTTDTGEFTRDVNLYRATGGSLYYLRHGSVAEGSEKVKVVTRDRDTGVVLGEKLLTRNRDYTVDYVGGRVLLVQPVSATATSDWVVGNFDSSLSPGGGHPVYVQVRYEHSDPRSAGERSGGVSVRGRYQRVTVGAGLVAEDRGDSTYSLFGADVNVKLGRRSKVHMEVAGSRDRDAANMLSQDGGLTFRDMNQLANDFDPSRNQLQMAWKISGDAHLSDWTKKGPLSRTRVLMFAQKLDRGFSAGDSILEQGRLKLGALVSYKLNKTDQIRFRHIAEVAELPRIGPTMADVVANPDPLLLDERATHLTSLQWSRDDGRWHYRAEGSFHRMTSTAALADGSAALEANRLGFGGMAAYDYTKRLRLRAGQQVVVGLGDADPLLKPIDPMNSTIRSDEPLSGVTTNLGADWKLTKSAKLSADVYQRWNGDNAGQIGLSSGLGHGGTMYVRERVQSTQGHMVNTTIIGAEDRIGTTNARSYGEYQIENGILGNRNRAVLGVAHRWYARPDLRIALGFEHQQIFGGFLPDGTPVGNNQRNVGYTAAEFKRNRLRATAHLEVRVDNGLNGDALANLIATDSRSSANETSFADHGGTAPGAPLILTEGDMVQFVGSLGAAYKATRDHTGLARLRASNTLSRIGGDADFDDRARYMEATVGWAYRPHKIDWLNVLGRYSYLRDQRPLTALGDGVDGQSHVFAAIPMAKLPHDLRLSGKLAFKRTQAVAVLDGDDVLDVSSNALLWLLRVGYAFHKKWDASGELRQLVLWKSEGTESQFGTLLEVGYSVNEWVRLGIGYNLSHFSDNELADLERDSHGFFVRVTGQY